MTQIYHLQGWKYGMCGCGNSLQYHHWQAMLKYSLLTWWIVRPFSHASSDDVLSAQHKRAVGNEVSDVQHTQQLSNQRKQITCNDIQ
jgi:hypothetical protein